MDKGLIDLIPAAVEAVKQESMKKMKLFSSDGKADGLFRPAGIGHHQVGGQRVQSPLNALLGGIEGLQVNGNINFILCHCTHLPKAHK